MPMAGIFKGNNCMKNALCCGRLKMPTADISKASIATKCPRKDGKDCIEKAKIQI